MRGECESVRSARFSGEVDRIAQRARKAWVDGNADRDIPSIISA